MAVTKPSCKIIFVSMLVININACYAKIFPVVNEQFEICVKPENWSGRFDYSEMEIVAVTETKVYLNGTWLFLKEVKSPWQYELIAEKFERGVWNIQAYHKRIPDFCQVLHSPIDPWYLVTSKFEPYNCPYPSGVRLTR